MINIRSRIRRSKLNPWKKANSSPTKSAVGPTLTFARVPSSISGRWRGIAKGKLAKLKNFLFELPPAVPVQEPNELQRGLSQVAPGSEPREPDEPTDPTTSASPEVLDAMSVVLPAVQRTVGLVGAVDTTASQIDAPSLTCLQPLKTFNSIVGTIVDIHPYTQMALGVLTSAAQLIITQVNLDNTVSSLVPKIQDTLARIAQVISDCAQFVKNYSEMKSSWNRPGKNMMWEIQTVVNDYNRMLNELMQQYRDRAVRDIHINVYRVLEDINLDGMAYAAGAGLNTMKKCLDGTRTEILKEIVDWINDPDVNVPRILWLHGQAGRGKSAIAHTIAQWLKDTGGLASCFCFARDRQAERREEKMLTTITRDLADHDPTFRRALAGVFANNRSLMATPDVKQQWEKLLLAPLSQVSSGIVGNIVVVIDALDESGIESSRSHILSVLGSPRAAKLPSNFRLLVTSRSIPDIQVVLSSARHVKTMSLDDVPVVLAKRDIRLFVAMKLGGLEDMGDTEVNQITQKADGLFEWARLACEFIRPNTTGEMDKERFHKCIVLASGEGNALLDHMYCAILESVVSKRPTALARFHSVMQQVLYTLEALSVDGLNAMRRHFSHKNSDFDVTIILNFMGSLLSGVMDHNSPIRPLHASFYDFLTDHLRSGDYFVAKADIQTDLAVASLCVLYSGLQFNICGLESSYLLNSEVADLTERVNTNIPCYLSYACRFWVKHLQETKFEPTIAEHVKNILRNEKILFWLEALSLLGGLGNAAIALTSAGRWLQRKDGYEDVAALAKDGAKFIQNFASAISMSTPHLYVSSLPFSPERSMLSRTLKRKFPCIARVVAGHYKEWQAAQMVLQGHTNKVCSLAFSHDGTRIVSSSNDKTVRVWDADRGVQIGSPLEGHTGWVKSAVFSPDGTRIVSGSDDKTVRIWDAERGVQIGSPLEGHTESVQSVAFHPDGVRIVSGSADNTVRIWDAERGVQIGSPLEGHTDYVNSVAITPDGSRIVSGSSDMTIRVWDAEKGVQISTSKGWHELLALSPDGTKIVSFSGNHIKVWDTKRHVKFGFLHQYCGVTSAAFSPDGTRIVLGLDDKTASIWDAERGVQIDNPLVGHTDWVQSVVFSPDGTRIVSGSSDNTVRIWDAEIGVQIGRPLEGHKLSVQSVAFSPDGTRVVSGSSDNTVRVWSAVRGVQISSPLEGHTDKVQSVAFSPDGIRIVSGSSGSTVRIWHADRGVQIGSPLEGHTDSVQSVAFSSDGTIIVSGSEDNTVRVWDAERGVQIGSPLEGHTDLVQSVALSPDGTRIVSGSSDNTVRIWDVERGVQIGSPLEGHTDWVRSVAFSPDGTRIVSGSDDTTIRIWDAKKNIQIGNSLEDHTEWVRSVAFSPDGTRIVSCSNDKTVRVWDARKGMQIGGPLEGHVDWIQSVAFSPNGTRIVSGSDDRTLRLWDTERGVETRSPLEGHTDSVQSVAFSPDGTRIVSGASDNTVRVWDAERGVRIGSPLESHADRVQSVSFSSDGTRIVSGSKDKTVIIWDAEKGVQIGSPLEGHTNWVQSVAFSPNGTRIVSGSDDKTMRIWDAERGMQIGSPLEGHKSLVVSVAFSPSGTRIVSGSWDRTVRIWDAERGVQIGSPLEGHTGWVQSVAFSPDGTRIVSGSSDKTVRIWDAEKGVQIGSPLEGHTDHVLSVAFSLDGTRIVSGSDDKTVRVWDAERGMQIGSPLEGHILSVQSVAFSPDGAKIVSGSNDTVVRVWDVNSWVKTSNHYKSALTNEEHSQHLDMAQCSDMPVDIKHPICFSSVPSHALQDDDGCLLQSFHGQQGFQKNVKLCKDGWIRGQNGQLLLWIPVPMRLQFFTIGTQLVIPRGCELDLSTMAHGKNWHECFDNPL
ncbi:WD40-repeat-containing domain protein [Scleroderma yunnanense]